MRIVCLARILHLQKLQEERFVRGIGGLDFFAETGSGSLEALNGYAIHYQLYSTVGKSSEK